MAHELPLFDVETEAADGVVTLSLTGELDYGTVGTLQGSLAGVVRKHPADRLRIDLRGLEFIDSAGMSALIAAHADARGRGTTMQIVRGSERVQRPLEVVGLDQIVEFVDE